MTGPDVFRVDDDLTEQLTVLEASAGTGKTYALAALATRFIAEREVKASELCVVSFTEAATAELRGRLRERLAEAATYLRSGAGEGATTDLVLKRLVDCGAVERAARVRKLERAVTDFDAATISTIHGFCSRVVSAAGAPGIDLGLSDDDSDITEIVNDVMLARYADGTRCPTRAKDLIEAVRLRVRMPAARMWTCERVTDTEGRPTKELVGGGRKLNDGQMVIAADVDAVAALVEELVAEVLRRRARTRRRTFDSLITDARDILTGPGSAAVVAALRERFELVLIDEFQDTDQVQWDIFRTAFLDGPDRVPVVLVGDPKQSIYRFRSAELSAYLAALDYAETHGGRITSLSVNHRTDKPLLDGLEKLFDGYAFGAPRVGFQHVEPREGAGTPLLGVDPVPFRIRCVPDDVGTAGTARSIVVPDLVSEVVGLLETAELDDDGTVRRLRARDIGVLVRSNRDAVLYASALSAAGVPAASSASDSVLDSPAALQWQILLRALDRPTSLGGARAAALGWFLGYDAAAVAAFDEPALSALVDQLRDWARTLDDGGLSRFLAASRSAGLQERVLARLGGERDLTDLDHVAELLQTATGGRPGSAAGLLGTLVDLADPSGPSADETLAPELLVRRIDRDDETVKVLTVHKAKGQEFPVVLCPTLWTQRSGAKGLPHGAIDGVRWIGTTKMVSNTWAGAFRSVTIQDDLERAEEDSRLLYVALTRAKHRLVVWWSPAGKSSLLGSVIEHAVSRGGGDGQDDEIDALVAGSGGRIARDDVARHVVARTLVVDPGDRPELSVATGTRTLDSTWRIWSFSAVKAAAEEHELEGAQGLVPPAPDAPAVGGVDEPSEVVPPLEAVLSTTTVPMPLQSAPAGTAFGTLVHSVMERVDFAADDVADQLRERCAELLHYRALAVTPDVLAAGLHHAMGAPLGGCMGERRLLDLGRADRLDELGFDLPLAGFDARTIAAVVLRHLRTDDALRRWFVEASEGGLAVDVAGLLTGSIDLVARTAVGRYWLADYKSNLISDGDYGHGSLTDAMAHHGYPLQATLYLVALHRYLRWRLPDYDPDRHLDGAAYLFLRGMDPSSSGSDTPGIVWWRPPTAAIEELDRLLATGMAP